MPNLSFLHVSLNLDTAEGREIAEGLARLPERQRSAIVRAALLGYLKRQSENGAIEGRKLVQKSKSPSPAFDPLSKSRPPKATKGCSEVQVQKQTKTIADQRTMSVIDLQEPGPGENDTPEKKIQDLFDLIQ